MKGVERVQSLGEEIANSVTHGVGALASVAVLPVLVVAALPGGAEIVEGRALQTRHQSPRAFINARFPGNGVGMQQAP